MKNYNHPNVLPLYCSFVTGQDLWMVMPYISGGSVLHIMKYAYPEVCVCACVRACACAKLCTFTCMCVRRVRPCTDLSSARVQAALECVGMCCKGHHAHHVTCTQASTRNAHMHACMGAMPRQIMRPKPAPTPPLAGAVDFDRAWTRRPSPPSCATCCAPWTTCTSRAASTEM